MGQKRIKRRQSHGGTWHCKQTDAGMASPLESKIAFRCLGRI